MKEPITMGAATLDYNRALLDQNRLFTELIAPADWTAPVPTCPGWSVQQLFRHVGRGDRWAAQIITDRAGADLDPRLVANGKPPEDPAGAIAWLAASPRVVIEAVAEAGPDTPAATFMGPRPAAWWLRRRLHEATVHRFDAALATGGEYDLSTELAADGIAEWLDLVGARGAAAWASTDTLSLRATDLDPGTPDTWTIRRLDGGEWTHDRDDSGTVVSGAVTDLFLALLRRRSTDEAGLTLSGDAATWSSWLAATPF